MKKLLPLIFLIPSFMFGAATTNYPVMRSAYSLNTNQFDVSQFPVTITNLDGSVVDGSTMTNLNTNAITAIASNAVGTATSPQFTKRITMFEYNNAVGNADGWEYGWAHSISGSAVHYPATSTTHPGVLLYSTVALAANYLIESAGNLFIPSSKASVFEFKVAITNLGDVRVWVGLSGQTATFIYNAETVPSSCAIFKYSTNSANWFFYTSGSGSTASDTLVPATINPVTLRIDYTPGVSAIASINGVRVATNSIAANLPNGVMTPLFINCTTTNNAKGLVIYSMYGETAW